MVGTAPVYRQVLLNRKIVWSAGNTIRFQSAEQAYAPDADPAAILASAGDAAAIAKANEHALSGLADGGKADDALYIISEADDPTAVKIGYSCRPADRLMQLQMATWRELRLVAVFYGVKANIPSMEMAVHQKAKSEDKWLRGEWFAYGPLEAVSLVMRVATERGRHLCGPDVLFDNLGARIKGLRQSQLQYREQVARETQELNRRVA